MVLRQKLRSSPFTLSRCGASFAKTALIEILASTLFTRPYIEKPNSARKSWDGSSPEVKSERAEKNSVGDIKRRPLCRCEEAGNSVSTQKQGKGDKEAYGSTKCKRFVLLSPAFVETVGGQPAKRKP
ncbi:hypothetical protein CIHG_02449 [Coccidioides immitis H538.4]|uniref:Uncharacterized protein n=3 Tax=Coccidioides immitis TaxID=5501 RepID=A0A0J8QXU9_COCIT|nr:hypothetical protein CIRG_02783 [Coccidioides immitis RMSCC 2394]KMU76193.1 hypothetical protein CISG_05560 [Coccidioides immitis RMSCC 3703]KMU84664.1 hypothetical protein CIHG_02449 [Coccidioides immitis H538.4]